MSTKGLCICDCNLCIFLNKKNQSTLVNFVPFVSLWSISVYFDPIGQL